MDCNLSGSTVHGDSPGKSIGVGFHALLQEIFPIQGPSPGLPHCRQILYHLNHQGSPSWSLGDANSWFHIWKNNFLISQLSSVTQLCPTLCDPLWTAASRASKPSPTPRACSNSCSSSWWCHPTISSSVVLFSSCLQSFPGSGSFPMSQLFTSGGQSIGFSASTSVLPMNIQDRFPLGLTGLTCLQSNGLSRVFSNTTVQKYQFFGAQFPL